MAQAKVLNEKEIRKVLLYIAAHKHSARNRAMFLLTTNCGLRAKEVAALRLCDVLTVEGKIREEFFLSAEKTKGSKGRTIYLSQKIQEELHKYLSSRFKLTDLLAVTYTDTNRALFASQKNSNRGFSPSTLAQHFHYLFKRAGIDGATSHSPRRTFITNLAAKGISVRVLMSLAGHRNISTTQSYIDVNDDMKRSAVELI
jgi:integrase/recombinase XerD